MHISSRILENVSLKPLTTFKIGGSARFFFSAQNEDDLRTAIYWANEKQVPTFVLGGGSNILVADSGFPGLVISLGKDFSGIRFDNALVTVGAAMPLPRLGNTLVDYGFCGFEFMCGIPGTVGGAVVMNAGTKVGEIRDVLASVQVMSSNGDIKTIHPAEMGFGHRTSRFKKAEILFFPLLLN